LARRQDGGGSGLIDNAIEAHCDSQAYMKWRESIDNLNTLIDGEGSNQCVKQLNKLK